MGKQLPKELQNLGKGIDKLKRPDLLKLIINEVQKEGIIGEEDTILALVMKIMLRLVKDAKATSSNVVVSDLSGGGKDFLTGCVCKVMLRKNEYFHRNGLTPAVFTYWKARAKNFTWDGKVIHLEDPDEELINCDGFKTMASGGTEKTVVKQQEAIDIKVEGKPVIIVTSLQTSINIEGIRRWDSCRVDTGKTLTENVMKRSALAQAGMLKTNTDEELREALQSMCPKEVIIPYALEIIKFLPNTLSMRTQHHKLFDYIKASAVLHQHQREKNEDGKIIATPFDFDYARFCFAKFKNTRGVPLNRDEEELINLLVENGRPMKVNDILSRISRGKDWLYGKIDRLKSVGILKQMWMWDDSANRDVMFLHATETSLLSARIDDIDSVVGNVNISTRNANSRVEKGKKVAFLHFAEIVRDIDNNRLKNNLEPVFSKYVTLSQKSRKPHHSNKNNNIQQKESNSSRISEKGKKCTEMHRNAKSKQQKRLGNFDDLSLNEKVKALKEYVNENVRGGYSITYANLTYAFSKKFIDYCFKNNILYKVKGNEYRCF